MLLSTRPAARGVFNAEGNGWDKPANINVQVFAHPARQRSR